MLLDTMMMYLNIAKLKAEDFFKDENGAVDIVAIVVLMGIVVLVALVFKDKLSGLVTDLFKTITGTATKAVKPE
ncbi:MAG: flagellin-like protein [Lachnospira sp.]|nr:flagellin-like protein [Lachnospira sp.]